MRTTRSMSKSDNATMQSSQSSKVKEIEQEELEEREKQGRSKRSKVQEVQEEQEEQEEASKEECTEKPRFFTKKLRGGKTYEVEEPQTPTKFKEVSHSIFSMRHVDTKKDPGKKTHIELNGDVFGSPLNRKISTMFAKIPSHKTAVKCSDETDTYFETPNGTKLTLSGVYGAFRTFSNSSPKIVLSSPKKQLDEKANNTKMKAVKEPTMVRKRQTYRVTEKGLLRARNERNRTGASRSTSQAQVMATGKPSDATATDYAEAAGLSNGLKWEWLHLIAYFILGKASQNENNLVCGTFHSNTEMMLIENLLFPEIAKKYKNGFQLTVEADLVSGSQVAKKITYTIETDDYTFSLDFNPQVANAPDISTYNYMKTILQALAEEKKPRNSSSSSSASPKKLSFL